MYRRQPNYGRRGRSYFKIRLIIALAVAGFALFSYFGSSQFNPVTGEKQYISLTQDQEVVLGLQAVPQMVQQHGGAYPDPELQDYVDEVGFHLVQNSLAADRGWEFEFTLLRDSQTVNAFALPGGQIFITAALYNQLETEGQLAGVLGHEIGHVLARHGAQRIAKSELTQGLVGAVAVGAESYDAARMASLVGSMVNMKYGRDDELESDQLGVQIMGEAGYDPRAMIGVMRILEAANQGAAPPEFMSTHPDPGNRVGQIENMIQEIYPNGVPEGLIP